MDKKILISCPIQNREWILPHYLKHIYNIDYNKNLIDIYFIVNNSNDKTLKILQDFKLNCEREYNSIIIDVINSKHKPKDERSNEVRDILTYDWLSYLRNLILNKCVELNCDYLFSCDSDILVKSNIINSLLDANKDVCASLIYNGYLFSPNEPYKYTNILKKREDGRYSHIVNFYTKNPDKCEDDRLIEVDFTGAVLLISKDVCKVSKYAKSDQGEDEAWSESVINNGYKMYCKPSMFSNHIMSKEILLKYLEENKDYND